MDIKCPNPNCIRHETRICQYDGQEDKSFRCPICGSQVRTYWTRKPEDISTDRIDEHGRPCVCYGSSASVYTRGIVDAKSLRQWQKDLRK